MTNVEALMSVRPLIIEICRRFARQHGADFDDAVGIASLVFLENFDRYDPTRARLTTWTYWKVWWELTSRRRRDTKRAMRDRERLSPRNNTFEALVADLSTDARHVLYMLVDIPRHCRYKQRWLRQQLSEREGWSDARITRTFDELEEAATATS